VNLEEKLIRTIASSPGFVVLRSDLRHFCANESQLSRALKKLIERNVIQRVSSGAYVKTKINKFTNELTPAASLEVVAKELFQRLNVEITPPATVEEYNNRTTTQVPPGGSVVVKGRRITRKITVAGRTVRYV
jgi:hypothetical protein